MFMFYFYDDEPGYTPKMIEIDEKDLTKAELEFFNDGVRKAWNYKNDEWYLSVVDVVKVLTDSENPRKYWNKLKERLIKEGSQPVTNCHQLKMKAADGKLRLTDCATVEQTLRIIQSIPSKKAEPYRKDDAYGYIPRVYGTLNLCVIDCCHS